MPAISPKWKQNNSLVYFQTSQRKFTWPLKNLSRDNPDPSQDSFPSTAIFFVQSEKQQGRTK